VAFQGRKTAAARCRPGERPPSLPAPDAFHSGPIPQHTARRVKDHANNNPLRPGRGLGAPSPQRERLTTPALPGASVLVLHAQCLLPTSKVRGELSKCPKMVLQSYV